VKKFLLTGLVFFLIASPIYSQKKADSSIVFKEVLLDSSYHVVFIEKNRTERFKKEMKRSAISSEAIAEQLKNIHDSLNIAIKKFPVKPIAQKWYSLYLFRDKYYVYEASDPGTNPWMIINDSTIQELHFDPGVVVSAITAVNRKDNAITLTFSNPTEGSQRMTVHQVNPDRGIAVFERHYGSPETRYTLMVAGDKLNLYPVMVNYGSGGRVEEWKFDNPDFEKILKTRK
jgi:hypothetical protein